MARLLNFLNHCGIGNAPQPALRCSIRNLYGFSLIAIENVRLFKELQERNRELTESLFDISHY